MSKPTFLITSPDYEDAVVYCSAWSKEIKDEAVSKGYDVIDLPGKKANRAEFEGRINQNSPVFVMLNGHGLPDIIWGDKDEILLRINDNDAIMKNRIVYARSCFSLSKLGKSCSAKGAKAFVGYKAPFMFVSDPTRSASNPLKDKLAAPCFISSNSVPLSLLKGNTVKESIERSAEQTNKLISHWKVQNIVEAPVIVACLMYNKRALSFEGNGNATA